MKVFAKVKTKRKEEKLEKIDNNHFLIFVKELPEKGKANQAILRILAKHFKASVSNFKIISGASSKNKVIEIKNQKKDPR